MKKYLILLFISFFLKTPSFAVTTTPVDKSSSILHPIKKSPSKKAFRKWRKATKNKDKTARKVQIWIIFGLIFAFWGLGILGFIFSLLAFIAIEENPDLKGRGLALTALVINGLKLVLIMLALSFTL